MMTVNDEKARPSKHLAQLVCAGLLGLIAWTAWDFGGGYVSTKFVAMAGLALLLITTVGWQVARRGRLPGLPAVAVVAGLVCCGGYLQTIELPIPLTSWLSPASASASTEWVPDPIRDEVATDAATAIDFEKIPISLDPESTRMALAQPASFAIAVWLCSLLLPIGRTAVFFLASVAAVGGFFAFFGLADAVLLMQASTMELWERLLITPGGTRSAFGPFINNNNAGGFLNLAIACGIGVTVYVLRGKEWMRSVLLFVCLVMLAVLIAGVFGSKSRGAFLGLVAGTLCLSIVVLRSGVKSRIVWMVSGLICVACTLLMGVGLLSHFRGRIRTLWTGDAWEDPRLAHWQDSLNAAMSYFPGGAGLGSYRYAYLPYQSQSGGSWFLHADGMPFEWLLEGGIWLPALVAIAMVFLIRDLFRLARQAKANAAERPRSSEALLMAMLFALPSMVVSQCFDYGILQPSLLITFACLCGGVAGYAAQTQACAAFEALERSRKAVATSRLRIFVQGTAVLCLCLGMVLSTVQLYVGATVESVERERLTAMKIPITERPNRRQEIARVSMLARFQTRDASVHLLLAQLLIDDQQRRGAVFLVDEGLASAEQVGDLVSTRTLRKTHYACTKQRQQAASNPDAAESGCATIEGLMLPGQDLESWQQARRHAARALVRRPLDDRARVLLVELDMLNESSAKISPQLVEQVKRLHSMNSSVQHSLSQL